MIFNFSKKISLGLFFLVLGVVCFAEEDRLIVVKAYTVYDAYENSTISDGETKTTIRRVYKDSNSTEYKIDVLKSYKQGWLQGAEMDFYYIKSGYIRLGRTLIKNGLH